MKSFNFEWFCGVFLFFLHFQFLVCKSNWFGVRLCTFMRANEARVSMTMTMRDHHHHHYHHHHAPPPSHVLSIFRKLLCNGCAALFTLCMLSYAYVLHSKQMSGIPTPPIPLTPYVQTITHTHVSNNQSLTNNSHVHTYDTYTLHTSTNHIHVGL